jgi:flavin-dependent dehydrogenase
VNAPVTAELPVVVIGADPAGLAAAAHLADLESADRVELTLPEAGVCGGSGLYDTPQTAEDGDQTGSGGCCA